MKMADITDFFQHVVPFVEGTLDRILPPEARPPARLHEAMRYSVFAGGKRLRPLLCVAGYRAFRSDWKSILPVAASIELVPTYSLIHDDLPAMDDDDFRRGMPSCHKQFGEAIAILAGDALLTLAFETIAGEKDFPPKRILEVLSTLSDAAGTHESFPGSATESASLRALPEGSMQGSDLLWVFPGPGIPFPARGQRWRVVDPR